LLDSGAFKGSFSLFRWPDSKACWPDTSLMRGKEKRNSYETQQCFTASSSPHNAHYSDEPEVSRTAHLLLQTLSQFATIRPAMRRLCARFLQEPRIFSEKSTKGSNRFLASSEIAGYNWIPSRPRPGTTLSILGDPMKRSLFPFASLAALWLAQQATALAQTPPLSVKTVEFNSEAVGRRMKYNIILPANYEQSTDRYPVLYMLHGLTGNYTNWVGLGVPNYARARNLIVVMPDAGNSWYVNWAKSDDGQKNNWEDSIVKDVIGHVDANHRTIAKREGRAINGASMGGYGGLMLGLRHPDIFCSIGSHSGALTIAKSAAERMKNGKDQAKKAGKVPATTPDPKIGIEGFSSQAERTPKGQMFSSLENCAAYDPFELVLKVPHDKLPHIYLDCGTEDALIKGSRELVKLLMDHKIPFTYAESNGAHDGAYWTREVGHSMAVQYAIMQRNLAKAKAAEGTGKDKK
jgi:putative tributyrin esterase